MQSKKQKPRSIGLLVMLGVLCLVLLGLAVGSSSNEGRRAGADGYREASPPSPLPGQNLVQNGGFENGLDGWQLTGPGPQGTLQISTTMVHSGAKALEVQAQAVVTEIARVDQAISARYESAEISFWVYPASGSAGSFGIAGLDHNNLYTSNMVVDFLDDGSTFIYAGRRLDDGSLELMYERIPNVFVPDSWNKVVVQVDETGQTQDFYVNDTLTASLTSALPWPPAINVGFGSGGTKAGTGRPEPDTFSGTVYFDDISITGTPEEPQGCPFGADVVLAVEDETFNDENWDLLAEFDSGWRLDFAKQGPYPFTGHPVPGRWMRASYVRPPNLTSENIQKMSLSSWYAQNLVPATGSLQAIQFDFDIKGDDHRVMPLIFQNNGVYIGPRVDVGQSSGWLAYSSGCLTSNDFRRETVFPTNPIYHPDFSQPMAFGYRVENESNLGAETKDHHIDNFRVFVDAPMMLGDPLVIENRHPVAISDYYLIPFTEDHRMLFPEIGLDVLGNDFDREGDSLFIVSVTQPNMSNPKGETRIIFVPDPIHRDVLVYAADSTQRFAKHEVVEFTYVVSDGQLEDGALVELEFTDECVLETAARTATPAKTATDAPADSTLDLGLIRRFRDELMRQTQEGNRLADAYYSATPEILQLFALQRPDLAAMLVEMVRLLQPAIRDRLDGEGTRPLSLAQMNTVSAFFAELSEVASPALQQLIADEMARLGPLDAYVGLPVGDVLQTVLGDPVNTASEEAPRPTPTDFVLEQNFPNPFAATTEIRYALSRRTSVSLAVYDIQGRKVRTFVAGDQRPGVQSVTWDGLDDAGVAVPSGVYFVRLVTPTFQETKKMVVRR